MPLKKLDIVRTRATTREWRIAPNFPGVIASITLLALALGGCHKVERSQPSGELMESSSGALYLAHEVVVKKRSGATDEDLLRAVTEAKGTIVDVDSPVAKQLGYMRIILPESIYADQVITSLRQNESVFAVERHYIVELDVEPNDTLIDDLWAIEKIQCDKAWDITTGSDQIVVAVPDTGVDRTHPDLSPNIWSNPAEIPGNGVDDDNNGFVDDVHGWDFANDDNHPLDDHGHGTHCAGTIGGVGNNGQGIAGMAWNVKIMALKFLDADGRGSLLDATAAILYAIDQGVNIVNASWGCNGCDTSYLADAIEELNQSGGIFVAAAGNDAIHIDEYPHYPAAYGHDNIVSVAASSYQDQLASFSNYGQYKVDVAAPGENIMSTVPGGDYEPWSGTSMAAPHVSGLAALYLSVNDGLSPRNFRERLIATSDPIAALTNRVVANGRINAYRMLHDDSVAPDAPADFKATAGDKSDVLLSWSPVENDDLANYKIKWGFDSGEYVESLNVDPDEHDAQLFGLENGTTHYFVVHAVDQSGNVSLPSAERTAVPADNLAPAQVVDLTANPPRGHKASGWIFAASSEASEYYRAENAYDGSPESSWMSSPTLKDEEQYIIVELDETSVVDRVELSPPLAYPEAFPIDFDIELSMDGSAWTVVGGHRNFAVESNGIVEISFPATEATAIRLRVLRSYQHESNYYYCGVSEMGVFKVSDRPDALNVKFTAPGDDPGWGEATTYDLRYSKTLITEENFYEGTRVETWIPGGSGVLEKVLVEGLEEETEYYFALYAFDEAGNRSPLSNVARGSTIVVPPGVITDLEIAAVDADEVTLRWTAPGDNGYEGQAAKYDIRYSTEPITAGNFETAGRVMGAPIPGVAGTQEEVYIVNLQDAFDSSSVAQCNIDFDPDYTGPCELPTECTLNNGPIPSSCSKIEGGQIGQVGIVIDIGSVQVTIDEWIEKEGASGEFVGFEYTVLGGEVYVSVKAGLDAHMENGDGVWMHPAGTSGPNAKAISNVVFCNCDDDDDGGNPGYDPGDGGSYDPECDECLEDIDPSGYYYFAVRAIDDRGAMGGLSNVPSGKIESIGDDTTSPAPVNNLETYESLNTVSHVLNVARSSSHFEENFAAQNLTDDDLETEWVSKNAPGDEAEWIVFDLGQWLPISEFRMHPSLYGARVDNYPQDFEIQVSSDEHNWETAVKVEGLRGELSVWNEWSAEVSVTRYVRIYITKRGQASCDEAGDCVLPSPVIISEFEVYGPTPQFDADLVWIAPGDDCWIGQGIEYDLRHSYAPISENSFGDAERISIAPPGFVGDLEARTIPELVFCTTNYFAIKTVDDNGNWSCMSNVATIHAPCLPPAPVVDLEVTDVTKASVDLEWTAVGNDIFSGTAAAYDLRYSRYPLNSDNWESATRALNVPPPMPAGSLEQFTVVDLESDTAYYFAVRVVDDEGSQSLMSNVVMARTLDDTKPATVIDLYAEPFGSDSTNRIELAVFDSSSFYSAVMGGEMLLDMDETTMWLSDIKDNVEIEYVEFALAEPQAIETLKLLPAPGFEDLFPEDFSIEVKNDPNPDGEWTEVLFESGFVTTGAWEEWALGSVIATDIRLVVEKTGAWNEGYATALAEFEVYNYSVISDRIDLMWTAPGDDGFDGRATSYDLRRDFTSILDEQAFDGATAIGNVPPPRTGGEIEVFVETGLKPETEYCFAIKAGDEQGNASDLSNSPCATTTGMPPATISDLELVELNASTATLSWTAPGDDGMEGQAATYQIKVSESRINRSNWDEATDVEHTLVPSPAGTTESYVVAGLKGKTKYYFAVRALDSSENRGGVSNNAWGRTLDAIPPSTIINLKAVPYNPTNALPMDLTIDDVSGEYSSTTAADLLLDHNAETIWLSPPRDEIVPEYVEFDLGGTKVLGKMRLLGAPSFEDLFPVDFTIEIKESEQSNWKPVLSETFFGTNGDWEEWVMGAVTAVKARILITNTAMWSGSHFTALAEFELYENPNQFDTVLLSWNAPGGDGNTGRAASYDLRRADDPIGNDNLFEGALVLPDVQTPSPEGILERYKLDGLQPQTQYCFAIKSVDDVGNVSGLSNSPCVTTPGEPPSTIISLEVVDATTDSLSITWTAPGEDGEDGQAESYVIKYSTERINTINWNAATSVEDPPQPGPAGTFEVHTIENLEGSTKYYIAIRAIDSGENISAISNNAIGETLDVVPPSAITDLFAETNHDAWGSLHVHWTAPGGNGPVGTASDYDLRISKSEITEENFYQNERLQTPFPNPSGTSESITIYDRDPEALYYLAIKSLDNAENTSDLSNVVSARTRDENPGDILDLAIIGSTGTQTDNGTITLQWTAPGDDAYLGTAHHYDIRYSQTSISAGAFASLPQVSNPLLPLEAGTVQQFTIDGLQLEKTYYFAIKTIDERGNESGISNIPSGATEDEVPPSPVIDLVAATGTMRGTVDLTWTEPGDDEMTGSVDTYDIRWSHAPITPDNFEAATPSRTSPGGGGGGATRKFTVAGLPDEVQLHFALKANDDAGNLSLMSNNAPARSPDVAPGKILEMAQQSATLTSITISWTATGDDQYEGTATETNLRVSETPITEENFAAATRVLTDPPQVSGTTQSRTAEGLEANTQYYFAIKAVDDRGNWSPISVLGNCQTVDNVPPGQINPLNAQTHPAAGMIKLDWIATGDDGDVGRATTYELRCSTSILTEENFEQAMLIGGLRPPNQSGASESFTVTDLPGETLIHCAIRAIDEVGNKGPISPDSSCETQPIPPAPIDDLAGTAVRPRSVILTWTAPGDNGREGTATSYDIRYSETMITTYNFSYCQQAPVIPTPLPAGTAQTTTVPGLKESTLYYFAIKTTDDKGAISALSNVAEVITLDETAPCAPDPVQVYSSEGYGWTGGYVLDPAGASASTQLADSLGPDKTLDKDQKTMWVSHGIEYPRPESLTIDIGYETNVDKIRLMPNIEYIHLFPQNFTVSVSDDNENWTQVHRVEEFDSPTESWMTWAFYPRRARYVKVTAYDTMISYFGLFWTVIADMEVYKARSLCGGTWLSWEAPGDDCDEGTVTYYDIFYSLSLFDNDTLYTATRVGTPSYFEPGPAGTWEGVGIGGLKGETRYYFAVRAVDEAGNVGPISEVVTTTTPKTPPAPVEDLEAIDVGLYEATLKWTASGDDGRVGTATSYEMRYAPWSITAENFHLATEVPSMPVPEPSGTQQMVMVEDLESETLYRFAMVVKDEHESTSYISNVALVQTLPEPDFTAPNTVSDLQAVELTEGQQTLPGEATSWSSQQSPDFVAGAIIDGDKDTLWSSVARDASQTEWVDIDLGKVEAVTQLKIWPHNSYVDLFPPSLEVQVSADRLSWNTVFSITDYVAEQGVPVEGTFPVVPVRYVKFLAKELSPNTNGYYYAVVSELELITPPTEAGTIVTSWTASGDDGDEGQASSYDLRIGSCPYDHENAASIPTMEPQVAGSQENVRITGLADGTYCLGLKVSDEAGNDSTLSNVAEVTTTAW